MRATRAMQNVPSMDAMQVAAMRLRLRLVMQLPQQGLVTKSSNLHASPAMA